MKIYRVTDPEFAPYGTVLDISADELFPLAEMIEMPESGSKYEPSFDSFENTSLARQLQEDVYGELPIQIGYCWGHNTKLNALEWHKSSELNIAVTDFVLMLARLDDLVDGKLDSAKVKAFLVKKGETVEVYAPTLHFCPCTTDPAGFGCVVVLPKGTNVPLENKPTDPRLFRKNKWLLSHCDNKPLLDRGAVAGIFGENYDIGE